MDERKNYTLKQIIAIADKAYPDGLVGQAFEAEQGSTPKEDVGDTLATFIVRKLKDTFDPKATALDQLKAAYWVITNAAMDLGDVAIAFGDATGDLTVRGVA